MGSCFLRSLSLSHSLLLPSPLLSRAEGVQQEPWAHTTEGTGINIACSHPNIHFSTFSIIWYQQHLNQSPQFLLLVSTYKFREDSGRFSSVLSMENSQVLLHVQDAKLQDSAVYLCALSPHWCLQLAALYRKVQVL
uniref:Ig-like domain-containing protein n=1 Tax=Anas platyrhynchos TaxID=8839 RepID=A0A8B9ZIQ6_ANAPL